MVLYELLVGSPMYNIDTLPALCAAIVADPPVPLRSKRFDAPPELEAAVLCCTQKDPAQRFASVAEFAQAIASFGPPEGALLATRAARRLAPKGDALRLTGRLSVSGTLGSGRTASAAPAAVLSSPAPAPAPRRWQGTALAVGGAALAFLFITTLFAYARRDRPELTSPSSPSSPLSPPAASVRADARLPLPFAPGGPAIEPVASAAEPAGMPSATASATSSSVAPRKPLPPGRPAKPVSEFDDSALLNRR